MTLYGLPQKISVAIMVHLILCNIWRTHVTLNVQKYGVTKNSVKFNEQKTSSVPAGDTEPTDKYCSSYTLGNRPKVKSSAQNVRLWSVFAPETISKCRGRCPSWNPGWLRRGAYMHLADICVNHSLITSSITVCCSLHNTVALFYWN